MTREEELNEGLKALNEALRRQKVIIEAAKKTSEEIKEEKG